MREDFRTVTRLPVLTQFLLAPLPALLAGLAYGAWQWTQSNSGTLQSGNSHDHVLGWTILPLTATAAGLFLTAVSRAAHGRRTSGLLAATLMVVAAAGALASIR